MDDGVDKVVVGLPAEWRLRRALSAIGAGTVVAAWSAAYFVGHPGVAALASGVPVTVVILLAWFGGRVVLTPSGLRFQLMFVTVHFCRWAEVRDIELIAREASGGGRGRGGPMPGEVTEEILVHRHGRDTKGRTREPLRVPTPYRLRWAPQPGFAADADRIKAYWLSRTSV
ncbi:hypothetical protein [Kitasatospora sp. NPDC002040]|uniref:hypothetical protein n=1 Tax=Kitasatospora sp. NPDC002040 TaxID=3154661 RepID=UPI003333F9C2